MCRAGRFQIAIVSIRTGSVVSSSLLFDVSMFESHVSQLLDIRACF